MASIELRNVTKAYGKVVTLKNINLRIEDGELTVFVGPSGCGKSTMLRMIAGLEEITEGELLIDNEVVNDVTPADRGVAMVFQSYALYPHMTVAENMAYSLKIHKVPKAEIEREVHEVAKALQIEHLLDRKPKQLSGGQRQRVAIGRAIVRKPKVFTFDEPLSNLDAALRVKMRLEIAKLHKELNATIIYVTHDQVEAMTLADKICVLSPLKANAESNLEQFGSPLDLYNHPVNLFVAGFIGSPKMNFLKGEIQSIEDGKCVVKLITGERITAAVDASRSEVGAKVTLGVRPEHLVGSASEFADGGKVQGKVEVTENLGAESFLYMNSGATEVGCDFTVKSDSELDVGPGDDFVVGIPSTACHLFDADGKAFPRTAVYKRN